MHRPKDFSPSTLYRLYPRWKKSMVEGKSPVDDEVPWINFDAIDFLLEVLRPKMRVFEFGSGGSTLFFSRRVSEIISVEHDRVWFEKMEVILRERDVRNCDLRLIEPVLNPGAAPADPSNPKAHISGDDIFRQHSFKTYAGSIDEQPQASFDVVLVDGRARPSCLMHAIPKTKVGGYIIMDNAERSHYQSSYSLLPESNWKRREFFGPGPYNNYFWQTNTWERLR